MRVLQVITDTDRRGAQIFASDLHDALARRQHEVETVALEAGATPDGLELPVLGPRRLDLHGLRRLRRRMKWSEVTVAHGSTTGTACALAGLGLSTPFVYRQISDSKFWSPTQARRIRVRIMLRRACLVTALSEVAADTLVHYIGIEPSRVRIVANGVRVGAFTPATPVQRSTARAALGLADVPTIVFVGALVPEKAADLAIGAMSHLAGWDLIMVGEGPDRARLEGAAERLAPGRVHFLGSLPDPVVAYHAADVNVLSSRSDSMPATLIEAALCALPSVATRVGSIADIVIDDRTGLLVDPGDLDGLAEALRQLTGDPAMRRRLGTAAREHCRARFDIDVVAEAWERVLLEAVAGTADASLPPGA